MGTFSGFPSGRLNFTAIPDLFFSQALPSIDSLAELKVTLHVLWRVQLKKGSTQYATLQELLGDGTLLRGLQGLAQSPEDALRFGLAQALARGTLLLLVGAEQEEHFYFVNSAQGRQTVERARLGEIELAKGGDKPAPTLPAERPNIFVLYEQNIGLLQPIIAEELQEAEGAYPQEWIEEAFRIAVESNVRSWRYVRRILERWATEGRGKEREKTWYTPEEYRKYVKR